MVTGRSYLTLVVDNTNNFQKRKRECSHEYEPTIFDRFFMYITDVPFSTFMKRGIYGVIFILLLPIAIEIVFVFTK